MRCAKRLAYRIGCVKFFGTIRVRFSEMIGDRWSQIASSAVRRSFSLADWPSEEFLARADPGVMVASPASVEGPGLAIEGRIAYKMTVAEEAR